MARQKEMTEELLEKTKEIDEKFSSLPLDQRRQLEKLENTIEEFAENAISDLETTEKQLRQSKEESNINQKKELSYPEARKVMVEELGIDEDKAEEFVEKLDTKKDGKIDLSELKEINKLTESRLERVETLDIEDDEKKK
ncbi:hypothetical protein MHBO_002435 [Bonamia ostreae]|uniref:EF-hand domain-containing protein n=1 Tax=Bonamia ostreae TaxID=126728 RepID=A0ABV2AMB6_9EUKA